jgi:hypothetical protein
MRREQTHEIMRRKNQSGRSVVFLIFIRVFPFLYLF